MLASQLIVELQKLIATHGDLYVENDQGSVINYVEWNNDIEDSDAVFVLQ